MDGGWYWLTMEGNSAIGGLVNKDVLKNKNMVMPTDAGDSVNEVDGQGAVLLQHTSGHVGILPTILPVPDVDPGPVNVCDYTGAGTTASPYRRETSNCMMGDGKAMLRVLGTEGLYTGERNAIPPGGEVLRPLAAGASVELTFDLRGNGSGNGVGRTPGIPTLEFRPLQVDGPVGSHGQGVAQDLGDTVGPQGKRRHFTSELFFQTEGFLQGIEVALVGFEDQVLLQDPAAVLVQLVAGVPLGNLFEASQNLHENFRGLESPTRRNSEISLSRKRLSTSRLPKKAGRESTRTGNFPGRLSAIMKQSSWLDEGQS